MARDGPLAPLPPEAVETAVSATITSEVETVRRIEAGVNDLFRIEPTNGRPLVFKSPRYASESAFLAEPRLLDRLQEETSIPVPTVVSRSRAEESPHGRSFYLMEYLAGRSDLDILSLDPNSRQTVVGSAGQHLAALEDLNIDGGYGTLLVEDGLLGAAEPAERWDEQFRKMTETLRRDLLGRGPLADSSPRFDDLAERIPAALASRSLDEPPASQLVMTDYRVGNLVLGDVDADTLIRGLVDVGGIIGDGRLAVAMTEEAMIDGPLGGTDEAETLRTILRSHYAEARGQEPAKIFDEQYEHYRLFARADRMAAFDYTAAFAREDSDDAIADRWRQFVQARLADVNDQ